MAESSATGGTDLQFKSTSSQNPEKEIAYIYNDEVLRATNRLRAVSGRADMVHTLIEAYGLLSRLQVCSPPSATENDILRFHSTCFVQSIQNFSKLDDEDPEKDALYSSEGQEYGLGYDCLVPEGLYEDLLKIVGASLHGANLLVNGKCQVAVNWNGGWHHAKRDEASGYCYFNDIVLSILKLREKFTNILYVDLDLHHGDGVQDAFYHTTHVLTVSFHRFTSGFFPGTGSIQETGICRGTYHTINVPLKEGIKDYEFVSLFIKTIEAIRRVYSVDAVVCQCGVDGLQGDPMDSFNLTHKAFAKCIYFLQKWNLPLLVLGGGGYNFANTAICWTYITGMLVNKQLNLDIPDHTYFTSYGPTYELAVTVGNRLNRNNKTYLIEIFTKIMTNIKNLAKFQKEISDKLHHNIT